MHSLSEHNKNTDQKNVKLSQAIKKADLPAMKSFNEHLENACSREPVPIFAQVVTQDMPSNRQGETEEGHMYLHTVSTNQMNRMSAPPVNTALKETEADVEEIKEEQKADNQIVGARGKITPPENQEDSPDFAESLVEVDKLGEVAGKGASVVNHESIDQIKKEHLIQTLQSLQYMKTAEKPAKA